ncbi:MAG: alpha/beta fold hydrolase [Cytophagales bacterium]|nr:MAG: alpha/beta fold hydrolase [Cytophagales bacterium]
MAIITSNYQPNCLFRNGHVQTIFPALLRSINGFNYQRERIITPDEDFLDLDWSKVGSKNLALISHGLEGSSDTAYAKGMSKILNKHQIDALVWNYRGCSGEINLLPRYYHSGETGDLQTVINHILALNQYESIYLLGFSVGGNITLKYLGEQSSNIHPLIKSAITYSVPCDLEASAKHLSKIQNKIYLKRFIKSLVFKIKEKAKIFPESFDITAIESIVNFEQFDNQFTAPMFGYASANEYWKSNSSKYFINSITLPTLIITAENDPFFTKACFPIEETKHHPKVDLELNKYGGHCGFGYSPFSNQFYSEQRTIEFLANCLLSKSKSAS